MAASIVEARPDHAKFLAWVLLAAHRSHLERGLWDFVVGGPTEECLSYLEALASTHEPHWAHYSTFLVAEVDAQPAAALCGYFDEDLGMHALSKAMPEVNQRTLRTTDDEREGFRRAGAIVNVAPEHEPGVWIVENIATLPEHRRRGLIDRLLAEILDRGRARGARKADIGVLIGNDPAQRAYEKAGFRVIGEKRHPDFEAVWKCPGVRSLTREL
jgi:ribosomal protein S18 acetylase RimI-like enzyme